MQKDKFCFLVDIADEYQITPKTLRFWIDPIYEELLGMYRRDRKRLTRLNKRQVERILSFLDGY